MHGSVEQQMFLVFRRTGQRRYAVEAQRAGFPDLEMNPAPGFDQRIPHDLMHAVVEAQLGLTHGIFGQVAAGGTAGTFRLLVKNDEGSRKITRARVRLSARGSKLMREGRDDALKSERATYICWHAWLARSSSAEERKLSATMAKQAQQVRNTAGAAELRALNQRKLDEICKHLDELSARWASLKVGESMRVGWPDLAIVND